MNFYRPSILTVFFVLLVAIELESVPQRNFRNRRIAKQELDPSDNEVTSVTPNVYNNNNPGYSSGNGLGGGLGAFLPPPLMMMLMMRNAVLGSLLGPNGIDMNTVQRVLQAVVKVLQEVEQEKRAAGSITSTSNTDI